MNEMFCSQCQETALGKGCTKRGVCGKSPEVSNLQDLLIYSLKGISKINLCLKKKDAGCREADLFVMNALFMTITNANFDKKRFVDAIKESIRIREKLKKKAAEVSVDCSMNHDELLDWNVSTEEEMEAKASEVGILSTQDEDLRALRQLLVLGTKGISAYCEHAHNLGYEKQEIFDDIQRNLLYSIDEYISKGELYQRILFCGKVGLQVMELLDKANTETFGNPEVTSVNIGVGTRPGILVSGHDLKDMDELLQQAEKENVDVYTHSEMLPTHYYPHFKKYGNLRGNYGNAWHLQTKEFETFNGPILFTTNCIVPPKSDATYANRVYTTGAAGFEGFPHIPDRKDGQPKDFSAIIDQAKKCAPPQAIEEGTIVGGFAHHQVVLLADKVVEALKSGAVRQFVVMAGCDGRMKSREYYTSFAQQLPPDTIILTAGCAKYRYNKLKLGDIGGIPRVLDAGQCNDSFSLIKIAAALKELIALDDLNKLPIVYNIAWYEQKAVIVLLALLSLGIKNIHLGPTLPGFLSPKIAEILVNEFGIGSIATAEEDVKNWCMQN